LVSNQHQGQLSLSSLPNNGLSGWSEVGTRSLVSDIREHCIIPCGRWRSILYVEFFIKRHTHSLTPLRLLRY